MRLATLHIQDFPAWVRRWLSPSESFVGVHADGRIISACAELREHGITPGESLARAHALMPEATFHEHDPHLDAAVWEDMLAVLADFSPHLRPLRQGATLLAPFDLDTLRSLNRTLGGSLGVARTSFVATLAACHAAPGGDITISEHEEQRFLAGASVRHLAAFGFEADIIERLEMFGLVTVARVMGLTRRHLSAQFGATGIALYDLLHEQDSTPPPVYVPPPAISETFTFETPACEPCELVPVLEHVVSIAVAALSTRHAQLLTLRLDGRNTTRTTRRVLKAPTADTRGLNHVAATLLDGMFGEPMEIRTLTVTLGALVERGGVQTGLFDGRPALVDVVRKIHRRFPGRLVRAILVDRDAYLPECAVRFEPYPHVTPPHSS